MAVPNPRPPLRTYSKRVLKESYKPPAKRKRTEEAPKAIESVESIEVVVEPVRKKAKAITDYFKPTPQSSSPSTPASSVFSSDQADESESSSPSSPSLEQSSDLQHKARARRRLSTRPALVPQVKMSDTVISANETHSDRRYRKQARANRPDDTFSSNFVDLAQTVPENTSILRREEAAGKANSVSSESSSDAEMPVSDVEHSAPVDIKNRPELIVPKGRAPSTPPNLVQQTLDLGAATTVQCQQCGFMYNTTKDFDNRKHQDYHADHVHGMSTKGLKILHNSQVIKEWFAVKDDGSERCIVAVDRDSSPSWRNLAIDVLQEHVDKELGTETTEHDILWSYIPDPTGARDPHWFGLGQTHKFNLKPENASEGVLRFKVYLYIKNKRVIGCLLAERAVCGFEVVRSQLKKDVEGKWPPIVKYEVKKLKRNEHEVALGVNKLWVHKDHRRHGYAERMLDCARATFLPKQKIRKDEIGFSQTTDLGSKFAERYMLGVAATTGAMDQRYLWLTYSEPDDRFRF